MINEIGSEFSLPSKALKSITPLSFFSFGTDNIFTFSGRTAIELALKDIKGNKKAFLPSYCCDSMIEPFRALDIGYAFYDVNFTDKFSVDLKIPNDCNILLLCNYFGFNTPSFDKEIYSFKSRGGIVIEDITHSLLSEKPFNKYSDYLVASLRKWGPLVSGGLCCKMFSEFKVKPVNKPADDFVKLKLEAMELKSQYLLDGDDDKKSKFLNLFQKSNSMLSENYSDLLIDSKSLELLSCFDIKKISKTRKDNAKILYDGIKNMSFIKPMFSLDAMNTPLFVPIVLTKEHRDVIRQRLIDNKIYCPVHWSHPKAQCESNLYDTELSLICDQRYTQDDMKRILDVLNHY